MAPLSQTASAQYRIELFGNFCITAGGRALDILNKARLRALLAYLILQTERAQPREQLAFLLWPQSEEAQARTNLRQLIHHLRKALPHDCGLLTADHQLVQWTPSLSCSVDVVEFDAALSSAADAARSHDADKELELLRTAAQLYQDDLLPGLYDDWLQPKRDQYRQKAASTFTRLIALCEEDREYPAAIRYAERLLAHDPLSEANHQLLIHLHELNRDRASALRAYHQCMRILRRELGVEPNAATRDLFDRVLKSEAPPVLAADALRNTEDSHSPLIGRKEEWQRLTDYWSIASAGGTRLAVIAGEPGIGKSRLAEELYTRCLQSRVSVARARCYAAQGRLAYAAVAEWLRTEALRTAWSQLPQSQIAELARVLPEILAAHPTIARPQPLAEGWERRHFYDALNAAFSKSRKPLLLVIDDLQWCDQDTFEWLHSFFQADIGGGVLVVGTVRSEEIERTHPFTRLWTELRQTDQALEIPLLPLDPADTATLAGQIANRPLNEPELAALYRSTQGNPLFVVETVRAGIGDDPGAAAASPRVRAVILARFAQLTTLANELVGFAGAVGRAFSFNLIMKATDWDEESLLRSIEELWNRRILETKTGGYYDFTHDLLREVAYTDLSPVRKRFLHRRIARALEEVHAADLENVAGQVAAHYASADMAEQAIRYHRRAAGAALQRFADREAAAELRRALALCREMPATAARKEQELEILIALVRTLITTLGYAAEEVGTCSSQAVALFRELRLAQYGVTALSCACVFHIVRGDFASTERLCAELFDLASGDYQNISAMAAHFDLGSVNFHLGRFQLAKDRFEKALENHARCSPEELVLFVTPEINIFCNSYLPHALWHLGYPDTALASSRQTIASANTTHYFGLALALVYGAMLDVFRGDSRTALIRARQAAEVCRRYDIVYYFSMAEILAGWAWALEGESAEGIAQLRRGIDGLRTTGAEIRLPFYYSLLADACSRAGKTSEALANISSGLAFQNKNGEIWSGPYLHLTHGDVLYREGNLQPALSSYQRALETARQINSPILELRAAIRICRTNPAHPLSLLEDLCARFTEGHNTTDLRDAYGLLERAQPRR
jgi:DNA-binding SARP family transcriptional activator